MHVEVAKFQLKGEYDASKKKKKCKDYKKKLSQQQKFVFFISVKYYLNSKVLLSFKCNAENCAKIEVFDSKIASTLHIGREEILKCCHD